MVELVELNGCRIGWSVAGRIDVDGSAIVVAREVVEAVVSSTRKVVASLVTDDRLDVVCACEVAETTCNRNSSQLLVGTFVELNQLICTYYMEHN